MPDGGDAEQVLARFAAAGIDIDALAPACNWMGRILRQVLARTLKRIAEKSAAWPT